MPSARFLFGIRLYFSAAICILFTACGPADESSDEGQHPPPVAIPKVAFPESAFTTDYAPVSPSELFPGRSGLHFIAMLDNQGRLVVEYLKFINTLGGDCNSAAAYYVMASTSETGFSAFQEKYIPPAPSIYPNGLTGIFRQLGESFEAQDTTIQKFELQLYSAAGTSIATLRSAETFCQTFVY